MKNIKKFFKAISLSAILALTGCTSVLSASPSQKKNTGTVVTPSAETDLSLSDIPAYVGEPYAVIHDNKPYFQDSDLTTQSYESYSKLDSLGRCGPAVASIGKDLMPTKKRESIGMVKPSGWHTAKYDGIEGNYLYNRCHLIGYQLTAENANERNLITGTRYMNTEGMEPFENMTADYIKETGNHVLYRVTPLFKDHNLVAQGVLMEAESVEDKGKGVEFCVFCYNVQPGITIDYRNGDSTRTVSSATSSPVETTQPSDKETDTGSDDYIGNKNTRVFHHPWCTSVSRMKDTNKVEFTSRDAAIQSGYKPCQKCNP